MWVARWVAAVGAALTLPGSDSPHPQTGGTSALGSTQGAYGRSYLLLHLLYTYFILTLVRAELFSRGLRTLPIFTPSLHLFNLTPFLLYTPPQLHTLSVP